MKIWKIKKNTELIAYVEVPNNCSGDTGFAALNIIRHMQDKNANGAQLLNAGEKIDNRINYYTLGGE